MKTFDYIIAGAGASGLTLAHLLLGHEDNKSVLIIEKDDKSANDRTWSFWEKEKNPFEELVYKKWSKAMVKGKSFAKTYDLAPYQYKMIKGKDFYDHLIPMIKSSERVTWIKDEVIDFGLDGTVKTTSDQYKGQYVFNSTINYQNLSFKNANNVLQHFKGWVIETPKPQFDVDIATYMDFSIDQEKDCRFGYVLPFSPTQALVEYTLFNKILLDQEEYNIRLSKYINHLGIDQYEVKEEEFGVIPMTDFDFKIRESEHLFNIGILGGFAKASTGYSFLRAQKILQKMAQNLFDGKSPEKDIPHQKKRFKKYDATLLEVLTSGKFTGEDIFVNLFEKNGAHAVFKFLDEETNLTEELKIMSSTPILDFGGAFIKQLAK